MTNSRGTREAWFCRDAIFGMVLICGPTDFDFIEGRFLTKFWCYTQSPHPITFLIKAQGEYKNLQKRAGATLKLETVEFGIPSHLL